MKNTFPFFVALVVTVICISVARAGEVKVEATMTTGPEDEAGTTFAADTPKIYAMFKTKGAKNGDKVRAVLIADDVGDAAPANTKVLEESVTMEEGDNDDGEFNFSKPTSGWPTGKYHVEIYVNDELATKVNFTIKAAVKSEKQSGEEEESSGD
jgi:hypothetical protein